MSPDVVVADHRRWRSVGCEEHAAVSFWRSSGSLQPALRTATALACSCMSPAGCNQCAADDKRVGQARGLQGMAWRLPVTAEAVAVRLISSLLLHGALENILVGLLNLSSELP